VRSATATYRNIAATQTCNAAKPTCPTPISTSTPYQNIQDETEYLDEEDELDQSPIRPTLGRSEGCDQLEGRGCGAPPPRLRPPPVVLLLSSDIEINGGVRDG